MAKVKNETTVPLTFVEANNWNKGHTETIKLEVPKNKIIDVGQKEHPNASENSKLTVVILDGLYAYERALTEEYKTNDRGMPKNKHLYVKEPYEVVKGLLSGDKAAKTLFKGDN